MLKKLAVPGLVLGALMAVAAPRPAKAEVHFGVYVGTPAYSYPAPVYSYDPYADYYNYPAPVYTYPAPVYVQPYSYGHNYRWRDHDRHEFREHERHELRERMEHRRRW